MVEAAPAPAEEVAEEKPKTRRTKAKEETPTVEAAAEVVQEQAAPAEEKPKRKSKKAADETPAIEVAAEAAETPAAPAQEVTEEKPKKKRTKATE